MTTPTPKRAGRPRVADGMITRPIAATPEQWATAEAIGTTFAEGTRMALDMAGKQRPTRDVLLDALAVVENMQVTMHGGRIIGLITDALLALENLIDAMEQEGAQDGNG